MEMMHSSAAPSPIGHRVFLAAALAAINNLAFGYDVGVISGSLADMASTLDLSTFEKEAATSGLNFLAGFGALLISGNLLDRLGRRATLLISSLLLLLGAAVVCLAQDFGVLLLGRVLQGLGSGCSWSACSVYITEIAPKQYRGALVAMADISINVGILIGYGLDYAVNKSVDDANVRWRVAMAFSASMPLLYTLLYPWVPETPRWLVMRGRDEEAAVVMRWFTGLGEAEAAEAVASIAAAASGERDVSWAGLLDRRAVPPGLLLLTCFLGLGQQLTGTEAILYYTPSIVNECPQGAIDPPAGCTATDAVFLINLSVGGCKLVGELVAVALVESAGRRRTLVASNLLVSALVFTIALKFLLGWSTLAGAVSLCLVMLFFSLGPGPLTFVVVNEIVPLQLRGRLVALSVFFNRLGSGTIALTFLSLEGSVGAFAAFSLYAALGVGVTAVYWLAVPDMKGKSLEEADAESAATRDDVADRSLLPVTAERSVVPSMSVSGGGIERQVG